MDRVKESLFNILGDIQGTRWLDLFAGTGQVGIEALSRGAEEVVFVDNTRAAIQTIFDNLKHTQLTSGARVIHSDAFQFLGAITKDLYDAIYVAPPQYKGLWIDVLRRIDLTPETYLSKGGMVIVQIDPREYLEPQLSRLHLADQRRYGNTLLCFFQVDA
jgi:16S rRNA (guanine(966)-N(2))-methyltransferase RsmD